ncbi:unnamed protein product [Allacma fusca]|uniref:CCHC-type domain-containing protein n=1 Tax=Allacma fusca TaxID=39272 RepID=A0A8J2JXA2_9HEXA|nr:unnamed protein product [Allacma fusca]
MVLRTGSELNTEKIGKSPRNELGMAETVSGTRRSQRRLNLPPEMLGLATPRRGGRHGNGKEVTNIDQENESTYELTDDTSNFSFPEFSQSSRKSKVSHDSRSHKTSTSRNTVIQRQRQLQLEAIKELDKIEEQEAQLLLRKKERIQKTLALTQANLEENSDTTDDDIEEVDMVTRNHTHGPEVVDWVNSITSEAEYPENQQENKINLDRSAFAPKRTMQSLRCTEHIRNPGLMEKLLGKLSSNLQLQWCMRDESENGRIDAFGHWLRRLSIAAARMPPIPTHSDKDFDGQNRQDQRKPVAKKQVFITTEPEKKTESKCWKCGKAEHFTDACKEFQEDGINARWKLVTEHKLCFNCINKGHQIINCPKKTKCEVNGCQRRHHKLLHKEPEVKEKTVAKQMCGHHSLSKMVKDVLLRVIPVKLSSPK